MQVQSAPHTVPSQESPGSPSWVPGISRLARLGRGDSAVLRAGQGAFFGSSAAVGVGARRRPPRSAPALQAAERPAASAIQIQRPCGRLRRRYCARLGCSRRRCKSWAQLHTEGPPYKDVVFGLFHVWHHDRAELLEVDFAILVLVDFLHDFLHFPSRERLVQVIQNLT
jgi:hypothetical protein